MTKPTTVRFTPQDKELIERVKQMYGCPSDIAAIRLALRMIAMQEIVPVPKPQTRNAHSSPT